MAENLGTLHDMMRREQESMKNAYLKFGESIPPLNQNSFQLLSGKVPKADTSQITNTPSKQGSSNEERIRQIMGGP